MFESPFNTEKMGKLLLCVDLAGGPGGCGERKEKVLGASWAWVRALVSGGKQKKKKEKG